MGDQANLDKMSKEELMLEVEKLKEKAAKALGKGEGSKKKVQDQAEEMAEKYKIEVEKLKKLKEGAAKSESYKKKVEEEVAKLKESYKKKEEEALKYKSVLDELSETVKCPVCLLLPMEGPVARFAKYM